MVTIYHWDLPQALVDLYGGWESEEIIEDYVNYAKTLFKAYGSKVKYWITFNEQNIFTSLGWLTAQHPPGKFDDQKTFYQVNHHVFMAHAKAVSGMLGNMGVDVPAEVEGLMGALDSFASMDITSHSLL
jgi:6-phospho-beta-glucosidase